ncbi:cytochrome-c peroxidase [Thiothrix lacustris]|uniref:cytochrome-c peroxidase n=1 Tax=Thiothrix lacustris TaxID=525917 RepID=UPI0027E45ADE|nr:cytochrome c peroxidase [Thiothrix lacustris]WMP19433.1 cytochrome c peroxidase [Thiothrix lacustris]
MKPLSGVYCLRPLLLFGVFSLLSANLWAGTDAALDHELHRLIRTHGLTGDPAKDKEIPDIQTPAVQLGMRLFFSSSLSGNRDVACASCHHPLLGGDDDLSLSIGTGVIEPDKLGLGRTLRDGKAPLVSRNAPTTFNAALWRWGMFQDGRIEALLDGKDKSTSSAYGIPSLGSNGFTTPDVAYPRTDFWAGSNLAQAQARFPLVFVEEMRGHDFNPELNNSAYRSKLAQRLGGYDPSGNSLPEAVTQYWQAAFRQVYNAPDAPISTLITDQNITDLLSQYERSQLFVKNPWNQYVKGDLNAISSEAKQGALLFYRQPGSGGFGCVNCHQSNFFTDEGFHNLLIPPIGPSQADKDVTEAHGVDKGREAVTEKPEDRFRFRTPSLLNVEVTGPWGHNGAYTTLDGIVQHMLRPRSAALAYDPRQLQQAGVQTDHLAANLEAMLPYAKGLPEYEYTAEDVQQLVAFLKTLTDPCVKDAACLKPWIPADAEPDLMHVQDKF